MHVLLEVWIFGGQVTEIRRFVFVTVPRMHGLIQSHGQRADSRGGREEEWEYTRVNTEQQQSQQHSHKSKEVDFETVTLLALPFNGFTDATVQIVSQMTLFCRT